MTGSGRWAAVASVAAALLAGCRPAADPLDLPTAGAVVARDLPHHQPFFRFYDGVGDSDDAYSTANFRLLVRAGLATMYRAPSLLARIPEPHYRLSAAGQRLAGGWRREERGVYEIPVGRFRLDRVLTIEMVAARHALVTYQYHFEPNAMGRLLRADRTAATSYFDPLSGKHRRVADDRPLSQEIELGHYENWRIETQAP